MLRSPPFFEARLTSQDAALSPGIALMPRPRVAEKRDHQINVALTDREFALIKERADAVGLRVIEYARKALLGRRTAVEAAKAVSTLDRQLLEAVRRVGVNLNQVTRQFNAFGHVVPPDLEPALRDIRMLVGRVLGHDSSVP